MVVIIPDCIIENHSPEHLHCLRNILCEIPGKSDELPVIHHRKLDGFTKQAGCRSYVEPFAGWAKYFPSKSLASGTVIAGFKWQKQINSMVISAFLRIACPMVMGITFLIGY